MLKIMTLNCNYMVDKHGAWGERREIIERMLREADPDIMALQAVTRHPDHFNGEDQASQIARSLGYGYHFFAVAEDGPDGRRNGQAVISRYHFEEPMVKKLSLRPGTDDQTHRLVLAIPILTEEGVIHVFNAHFSWIEEQVRDNICETMIFLEDFSGMGLLVGDMNAEIRSGVFAPLIEAGWEDIWASCQNPEEEGFTFESDKPSIRIDFAWANPVLKRYIHSIEVFNRESKNRKIRMSDHAALMVSLNLHAKGRPTAGDGAHPGQPPGIVD